jgi:hypothetical protein
MRHRRDELFGRWLVEKGYRIAWLKRFRAK